MLEIAGGILIAILILAVLVIILAALDWILAIIVVVAIATGVWFLIEAEYGPTVASGFCAAAVLGWIMWSSNQQNKDDVAQKKEKEEREENLQGQLVERHAKAEMERQRDIVRWTVRDRKLKAKQREMQRVRSEQYASEKAEQRNMCIEALRNGNDVSDINGKKMTLQDFGEMD